MTKLNVLSLKGEKKTLVDVPKNWSEKPNLKLLAQALRVYEDRLHPGLAKVKTRGEMGISTRKIYRQKGTGGARHGARSAPIFVGGGIAHGPKGVKRILMLPRKMKNKALNSAMSLKVNEGKVFFIDNLELLNKTKEVAQLISVYTGGKKNKKGNGITFILSEKNKDKIKFLKNLRDVKVANYHLINAYKVFKSGILLIDKAVASELGRGKKEGVGKQSSMLKKEKIESITKDKRINISKDSRLKQGKSKANSKKKVVKKVISQKKTKTVNKRPANR